MSVALRGGFFLVKIYVILTLGDFLEFIFPSS